MIRVDNLSPTFDVLEVPTHPGVSASMLQWGSDQATADRFLLETDVAWDSSMSE